MNPLERHSEKPPVMLGTAGHVDHGKTSLVKLITGCDTDRLKEEKERGMSINLGFAPCKLRGDRCVGVVDVPGHIDFIRNMVAGAASIDVLILVIAADDGVMPQTVEHMQIIKLLKAPRLIVALTKIDLVDEGMLALVKDEISAFLLQNGYAGAPVVPISNVTFEGIPELRAEIERMVDGIVISAEKRLFRMNIERVFQLKGFGTVISGIPCAGTLKVGDEVEILPIMKRSVVRGIQNYKRESSQTSAGMCSALNLRHSNASELSRGMTIVTPGACCPSKRAILRLENINREIEIKAGRSYRFLSGTANAIVRLLMIEPKKSLPGSTALCRAKFEEELVLWAGDRFVLRIDSPSATIGGGIILSASDIAEKRDSDVLRKNIAVANDAICRGDIFASEIFAGAKFAYSANELAFLTHLSGMCADEAVAERISDGTLLDVGGGGFLAIPHVHRLTGHLERLMKKYHANNPDSHGLNLESLAKFCGLESADPKKLAGKMAGLPASPFKISGGRFALRTFTPLSENPLKGRVLSVIKEAGANCIAKGNIIAETGADEKSLKAVIKILAEEKAIVIIGNHHISLEAFAECMDTFRNLAAAKSPVSVPEFKNTVGIGRNIAVEILEKFDAVGFTVRRPEGRTIRV
jgi:selenocysteine-specific elongation factor